MTRGWLLARICLTNGHAMAPIHPRRLIDHAQKTGQVGLETEYSVKVAFENASMWLSTICADVQRQASDLPILARTRTSDVAIGHVVN